MAIIAILIDRPMRRTTRRNKRVNSILNNLNGTDEKYWEGWESNL